MYFIDFFKNIVKKNNIGVLIWLLLNTIIVSTFFASIFYEVLYENTAISYLLGITIYIVILFISLSPIGEGILRIQNGCKEITRKEYIERLDHVFNDVYAKAKKKNPELPNNIKLFIYEEEYPNAFATGRRTICVTSGLLHYPDRYIKAILAHEFGHLAHKDTDAILIVHIGNLLVSAIFVIFRVVATLFIVFLSFFMELASEDLGVTIGNIIRGIFIDFLLVAAMHIWTKLGTLICLHSARKNEKLADEYAFRMGYGVALCQFLDNADSSMAKGLWATLNSTHPDNNERIAYLQELGCSYRSHELSISLKN